MPKILKQIISILISAPLGWYLSERLAVDGMIRLGMFFLIYVIVSLIIEFIFRTLDKKKI